MARHTMLARDVLWGIRWGIRGGVLLVILETIGRILGGPELHRSVGTTYVRAMLTDFLAGFPSGLVLGLLRSVLSSATAAAAVGFLAAVPAAEIMAFGLNNFRFSLDDAIGALIYALVMGAPMGVLLWFKAKDLERRRRAGAHRET